MNPEYYTHGGNINKNNTNLYQKYYTINLIFTKGVKNNNAINTIKTK